MKTKKAKDLEKGDIFFADRIFATCDVTISPGIFYRAFTLYEAGNGGQYKAEFVCQEAFGRISIFAHDTTTQEQCAIFSFDNEDIVIEQ